MEANRKLEKFTGLASGYDFLKLHGGEDGKTENEALQSGPLFRVAPGRNRQDEEGGKRRPRPARRVDRGQREYGGKDRSDSPAPGLTTPAGY
ncbi:hypothetical protein GCM10022406_36190 [Hymenobacter algoricola]|uniref:Uncharacterized protein n=1 Tax=Hymenobacter algoricola TaxID=486267 RepID=A0ABP7NNZ9_9BACT